jgi:hypothetical protein
MGSNTTLTAVTEEEREELGLYWPPPMHEDNDN